MSALKCHICNQDDTLQNLVRSEVRGEAVHAHKRCIDAHNKKVRENNRKFDATGLADLISSYDIDATDPYEVEKFLKERPPGKRNYFSGRRPSANEIAAAAREIWDEIRKKSLFELIERKAEAWPAKPAEDLIEHVLEYVSNILPPLNDNDTVAPRAIAALMIEQVARRKYDAESDLSYAEWAASDEGKEFVG